MFLQREYKCLTTRKHLHKCFSILDLKTTRKQRQMWSEVSVKDSHDRVFFTSRYIKSTLETSVLVEEEKRMCLTEDKCRLFMKTQALAVSRSLTNSQWSQDIAEQLHALLYFQRHSWIQGACFKILLICSILISRQNLVTCWELSGVEKVWKRANTHFTITMYWESTSGFQQQLHARFHLLIDKSSPWIKCHLFVHVCEHWGFI